MPNLLLKGGTLLVHGEDDKVEAIKGDLLVEGNIISKIDHVIAPAQGCEVLDCTDKIISPGFVDAHRHMWETALKGSVEDLTAVPYFATMFTASSTFTPRDIFWGNLAGCLEAIDAGTTTVLDFSHANWTEEHSLQALVGTITSGIRTVHAFAPSITLTKTSTEPEVGELISDWFMPTLEKLMRLSKTENDRVRMAVGFDFYFMSQDFVVDFFEKVRSLGIDIITSHWAKTRNWQGPGLPSMLKSYGLLDHRLVLSHMGGVRKEDAELLRQAEAFIVASPSTEMTMGLGPPVCFRPDLNINSICSIGVDCHCATSASMVNEVRIGLMAARGKEGRGKLGQGSFPVSASALDAFNMITVGGARALNMEQEIGSIKVGKKADLIVFDTTSPAMCPVLDPVTAIIMHSGIGDIETVIVDGEFRKEGRTLLPVKGFELTNDGLEQTHRDIMWRDIVVELRDSQRRFVKGLSKYNFRKLVAFVENLYGM